MNPDPQDSKENRAMLRVGVLTPHAAAGPEVELPEMAARLVTTVLARVRADESASAGTSVSPASRLRELADPSAWERAGAPFRTGSVDVVAHASTSTGYVLGHLAEAALVERLHQSCGVPVVASASSAVEALRACESHRVALVHPPWFDDEVDALGARYFRDQGFDVSLSRADGLPNDPARVRPEHVIDWVARHVDADADAVFLGGNGLRATGAIEDLERRTGLLVLQANQVLLWSILAATRTPVDVSGYGRLFGVPRSAAD